MSQQEELSQLLGGRLTCSVVDGLDVYSRCAGVIKPNEVVTFVYQLHQLLQLLRSPRLTLISKS